MLIIAAAGTLVLVGGGIDLSVGAIYGLASPPTTAQHVGAGLAVGIVARHRPGLRRGLVNGLIVTVPAHQRADRDTGDVVRDRRSGRA